MRSLVRMTVGLMVVAMVVGVTSGMECKAGEGASRFDKIGDLFGKSEIRPEKRTEATVMSNQRRIIYNDDGDAQYPNVNPRATEGIRGFLSDRFLPTVGTQVDTYFWCIGNGEEPAWGLEVPEAIGDANQVMVEAAHEAGMEIFASLRMNDIHDAWAAKLTYPLKVERPDLLIGKQYWPDGYPHLLADEKPQARGGYPTTATLRAFWSAFDYAKQDVRDHRYEYITKIAGEYDFDGFELDYFRHPLFFKLGEEEENLDTMTGFIRRVRQGLNQIGKERGRPYLLAVRVPPSPGQALRSGLDVETWLAQGLIDMLIPNPGYQPYTTNYKDFIDMGHHYGVPVYPCINCSGIVLRSTGTQERSAEKLRSVTSNFWALGGDGVYLFNFFVAWASNVPGGDEWDKAEGHSWLNEIGSPATLQGLDKLYRPDTGATSFYIGYGNAPGPFPIRLVDGTTIPLAVGDDVEAATQAGTIDEMRLRVNVSNVDESEGVVIKINGTSVPTENIEHPEAGYFEALLTAPPLQQGINEIVILPGRGSIGRLSSTVTGLELAVRYKQH